METILYIFAGLIIGFPIGWTVRHRLSTATQ